VPRAYARDDADLLSELNGQARVVVSKLASRLHAQPYAAAIAGARARSFRSHSLGRRFD